MDTLRIPTHLFVAFGPRFTESRRLNCFSLSRDPNDPRQSPIDNRQSAMETSAAAEEFV